MKRIISAFAAVLFFAVCVTACAHTAFRHDVPLGDGLPVWEFSSEYYEAALPDDAEEQHLEAVYTTDAANCPDILIYRIEKNDGDSLETIGQEAAAEHNAFCNMTEYGGFPTANVTYYQPSEDSHFIVRSYIFEGESEFVRVCSMHETEPVPLGLSDLYIRMISGYTAVNNDESVYPFERIYTYGDENLPTITIRQFASDYFTAEAYNSGLLPGTTAEQFGLYAENGWSLEEIISLYNENYTLLKGEVIHRNGFDACFIGYIDNGTFYVRAFIDYGDDYIVIGAENRADIFQHVVNALIDTIYR